MMTKPGWVGVLALASVVACDSAEDESPAGTGLTTSPGVTAAAGSTGDAVSGGTQGSTTGGPESDATGGAGTTEPPPEPPVVFDFGALPDVGAFCGAPNPVTCDDADDDPWHAMGLNCPGGPQVDGTFFGARRMYLSTGAGLLIELNETETNINSIVSHR